MSSDAKFKLAAVREVQNGTPIAEVARKFNVSRQSLHLWFARYKGTGGIASLHNKYLRGKAHPKSLSWNTKRAILDMVVRSPELGVHGISRELRRQGVLVSTFGVWRTLVRHNLQVRELREQFSQKAAGKTAFAHRLGTSARIEAVCEFTRGGKSISSICRKYLVTRKTFYSWLARYRHGPEDKFEALRRMYRRGYDHPQCKTGHLREKILEIVANNPQLSVHRLHPVCKETLGESAVSHQALQNLLVREGLNTYDLRMAYAKRMAEQIGVLPAPLYAPQMPIYRLRMLLAPFVTIPKLISANPSRGLLLLTLYCGPFLLFIFWVWILLTTRTGTPIGIFFASIALTFGFVFFVYSIKYYLAVILVLRLAQLGAGAPDSSKVRVPLQGKQSSKLGKYFAQLFKFKPRRSPNLLLANLEKVKLDFDNRPFVSIHVAVYNEKRVVERLIRACTAQEWNQAPPIMPTGTDYTDSAKSAQNQSNQRVGVANYEVIIADDSNDGTMEIAKEVLLSMDYSVARERYDEHMEIFRFGPPSDSPLPTVKIIHRFARAGFKGGALHEALQNTDARAEFIMVLDADFVPYADTISQFIKTFQVLAEGQPPAANSSTSPVSVNTSVHPWGVGSFHPRGGGEVSLGGSRIAAVQGYQWHVLNKSENWITRGVRSEYAGSYVVERSGAEIYGGLKQIAGSVYCIRADVLRQFGWGTSITEDFELTLRLYEAGYKVAFTPYIQAPAEAVSTIRRLVRQRMRWAEGASFNVKVMLGRMLFGRWEEATANSSTSPVSVNTSVHPWGVGSFHPRGGGEVSLGGEDKVWVPSRLTTAEKLEFAYLAPYYLQAAFLVVGTLAWFLSEAVFNSRLPFWTAAFGWSLVFTNLLALPLMNIVGLFLEETDEKDYLGILSFIVLSYMLVPFQAYAAIKGFLEKEEGPWFRTPKTGAITDVVRRMGTFHLRLWPSFAKASEGKPISADDGRLAPNLAYASAYNNFSNMRGEPAGRFKPKWRFLGRAVLIFLLVFSLLANYFAIQVPEAEATNIGANYGQWTDIYCVSATDCKVSYYDVTNADLRMADCDNAACSSGGDRAIDEGGNVGQYTSIYCIETSGGAGDASSNCKISYYDVTNGDLKFRDCDNATCDSGTTTLLDGRTGCALTGCSTTDNTGQYTSIYCISDTDCKISYYRVTGGDLMFADCDNATCSSGDATNVDSTNDVGLWSAIYCPATDDCKVSYYDNTANAKDLKFVDCGDAECTSTGRTITTVDTADNKGEYSSIYCVSSTDCKISYYAGTGANLKFADCDDATCATQGAGSPATVDSVGNVGQFTSVYCPATDDCKVSYYLSAETPALKFADCSATDCSTTDALTTVDTVGAVGEYTGIYCPAANDCKISYWNSTVGGTGDLKFYDCDDGAGAGQCDTGTATTVSLTVPEFIGFLIPVAPFLPRVARRFKAKWNRWRKGKKGWRPPKDSADYTDLN